MLRVKRGHASAPGIIGTSAAIYMAAVVDAERERVRRANKAVAVGSDSIPCFLFKCTVDIMTNLSIRGLDAKALADLKSRAAKEDASVNSLVVRLIEQGLGHRRPKPVLRRHDDLDALAGIWNKKEGVDFERVTTPFGEVDPQLWK